MKRICALLLLTLAACDGTTNADKGTNTNAAADVPAAATPPSQAPAPSTPAPSTPAAATPPATPPAPPVVVIPNGGDVTITGVQVFHSSARIYFAPVRGAKDYRIYDVNNPNDVKYAGLIHLTAAPGCAGNTNYDLLNSSCQSHFVTYADGSLAFPYRVAGSYPTGALGGPTGYDGPGYLIDYNGLGDGKQHTLVVEAVDALGPAPYMNLYKETDIKHFTAMVPHQHDPSHMVMLGSNKGPTQDGKTSTNGQGPSTNSPNVIARSQPLIVQRDVAYTPIIAGASQVFLDTFEDAEGATLTEQPGDCENYTNEHGDWGGREWTLNAGTDRAWRIIARQINCTETVPFVMSNHFMEVLSDRESTIYSAHAMTPDRSFTLNGGILHVTQMVDSVQSGGRWMDFNIAPADDPLTHWNHQDAALNKANQWIFMEVFRDDGHFLISNGPATNDPKQVGAWTESWGVNRGDLYDGRVFSPNGQGFDNKLRWDFFLSATWAALFIDGRLVGQGPVPADKATWLSRPLKIYFTDYLYHSESGQKQLMSNLIANPIGDCNIPMLAYWFNDPETGTVAGAQITTMLNGLRVPANGFGKNVCKQDTPAGFGFPRTNEWHRDDMGVSVIPSNLTKADDFSSLGALVQPPKITALQ